MSKRYSEEEKQNMISRYIAGESATELCHEYGIARSSLYLWVSHYSELKPAVKTSREIYLLKKEVKQLGYKTRFSI